MAFSRPNGGFISAFYDPLKTPNAPTIGTATGGNAQASVAFTAPSNVGGSAITSYTVVSSAGQTASGSASPIVVTGLATNTAYTFTVTATNSFGTGPASAASNSATTLPAIGSAYGGGYFAGQISTAGNGIADFNLVIGPVSGAQNTSRYWKTSSTDSPGTYSVINGPANSAAMNDANHPAAQYCEAVTAGGFTDWYMPAKNELEVCYYNLKPTTTSNNTSYGSNANAVPARGSNYTSGTPAQTSASDFRDTGAEDFNAAAYWSSTSQAAQYVFFQNFSNGAQPTSYKGNFRQYAVRAVRRVAV